MPTAVLTDSDRFPFSADDVHRLRSAGVAVHEVPGHARDAVLAAAPSAEALFVYSAQVDAEVIGRLTRCQVVVRCGSGYDNVDAVRARGAGIEVAYVPGYGTDDVAEHSLALMLAVARRVVSTNLDVRGGGWPSYGRIGVMHRLRGATLGLVGFGRIARRLAEICAALGMSVLAYDPFVPAADFAAAGVRGCSLNELADHADAVSLHLPLTPDTAGIIGAAFLRRLRPSAVLVNTSRGELVDEDALLAALEAGRLAGAGLDVLVREPPSADSRLVAHPAVVVTSHSAAFTEEALAAVRSQAIDEVLRVLAGQPPRHPVPSPS